MVFFIGVHDSIKISANLNSPLPSSFDLCTSLHLSRLEAHSWTARYAKSQAQLSLLKGQVLPMVPNSRYYVGGVMAWYHVTRDGLL